MKGVFNGWFSEGGLTCISCIQGVCLPLVCWDWKNLQQPWHWAQISLSASSYAVALWEGRYEKQLPCYRHLAWTFASSWLPFNFANRLSGPSNHLQPTLSYYDRQRLVKRRPSSQYRSGFVVSENFTGKFQPKLQMKDPRDLRCFQAFQTCLEASGVIKEQTFRCGRHVL